MASQALFQREVLTTRSIAPLSEHFGFEYVLWRVMTGNFPRFSRLVDQSIKFHL